ncbi:MAG: aminoglycoside/choline kinase family phosphotransferase [Gammaproteobacteria bacterium]|jgi:aminoglycoside/choline kinase family phosphotransferase
MLCYAFVRMNTRDAQREDWLQRALGTRPDCVTAASSDASFRRYFRVNQASLSRIVMDAPPPQEDCRPFVHVTDVLRAAGLQVPRIFAADVDSGFLLLSDLGDEVYLDALTDSNCNELYQDAISALVQMQRRCDASLLPLYDSQRLRDEMQLFIDWFWIQHLQLENIDEAATILNAAFEFLINEALGQPQVFVHRDYHSRNLMVLEHDNPGILDYQDAVLGPVGYDLVSLLRDVYVRWPQSRITSWVATYYELASASKLLGGAPASAFTRWFDLIGVQRHLKIAGIFARLYYRDGKPRYLRDIALTLDYLLEVAARYVELAPMVKLLVANDVRALNRQRVEYIDAACHSTRR